MIVSYSTIEIQAAVNPRLVLLCRQLKIVRYLVNSALKIVRERLLDPFQRIRAFTKLRRILINVVIPQSLRHLKDTTLLFSAVFVYLLKCLN